MSLNVKSSFEQNYSMLLSIAPALAEAFPVKKALYCSGYRLDVISRDELSRPYGIAIETDDSHGDDFQAFEITLSHEIHFAIPYLRRCNNRVYDISSGSCTSGIELADLSAALGTMLFTLHADGCRFQEACHE